MNGDYLLDSNIVIDIFRNKQSTIEAIKHLENINIPAFIGHEFSQITQINIDFFKFVEIIHHGLQKKHFHFRGRME